MAIHDRADRCPVEGGARLATRFIQQETRQQAVDTAIPRTWMGRIAYGISQVGSPPVLAGAGVFMTAGALATPRAWLWAGIYVVLAILSPLLFLVWLVRRGHVTDLDVQLRVQRSRPLLFTMACGGLAWLALVVGAAPGRMIALAGGITLQTVLLLGITLRWKISVHTATAAGVAVLACHLLRTPLPLLGVPLIAWSRVHLKRHTTTQTIAGGLLGATLFLIVLSVT